MKAKLITALAAIALSLPVNATAATAPICSVPVAKSITYSAGELQVETVWQARRWGRATVASRVWINGRVVASDRLTNEPIMGRYQYAAVIGTRKPRTAAFVVTIKSRDCTRTIRMFRRFRQ